MKQILRYTLLLLFIFVTGGGKAFAEDETFDFTKMDGFSSWNTTYSEHKIAGSISTVTFVSANKSSGTITDMPVTKGSDITVNLNNSDAYEITSVSLTLKQWGSKAQTVTLNTSSDGTTFTKTSTSSSDFSLSASDLSAKAIKFTFSSKSNQVGVQSITIGYKSSGKTITTTSFTGITDTKVTSTVNQTITATASVKADEAAISSATVTYTSSNEKIATVDTDGKVTTIAPGSTTITATYAGDDTYSASAASFTLTVKGEYSSIADMQSAIDKLSENGVESITADLTFTDVYVTGVNGNSAYISDKSHGMLIYTKDHGLKAGNALNGTVKEATLTLYNGAYEITNFSSTDLTVTETELSPSETTINNLTAITIGNYVIVKNLTYDADASTFTDADNNSIAYYDGLKSSVSLISGNKYDVTGVVGYSKAPQLMPTAATALAKVATLTITDNKTSLNTGAKDTYTLTYDGDGTVAVVSSDTDVATAAYDSDTKTITITAIAKGETTITISATAGSEYGIPAPVSYSIEVQEAGEATETFNYTDSDIKGQGESGGKNNGAFTVDRTNLTLSTTDAYGNTSYLQVYGSSSLTITAKEGYLISGVKFTGTSTDYIAEWKDQNGNKLTVKDTKATWTGKKVSVKITNSFAKQARLTSIEVSYLPLTDTNTTVTIGADGKATYCASANCIIGDGTVTKYITGTEENNTTLTEVDAPIIAAGEGVLLSGAADTYKVYTHSKLAPTKNANNKLVGCSEATTVPTGAYVMQKQNDCVAFYKVAESSTITCPAGKAYLSAMSSEAKAFYFSGDEATGIDSVAADSEETRGDIYTLSGVKVNKSNLTKGIYIVNGKKYIVK